MDVSREQMIEYRVDLNDETMSARVSMDLRCRILHDCDAGMRNRDVAAKFSVSVPFVKKLKRQRAQTRSIEPKPQGGGHRWELTM